MPNLAILIGAGASYGCGEVTPSTPPLGAELYDRLRRTFPGSWGALTPDLDSKFREEFEDGMALFWHDHNDDRLRQLLIEMGIYFARFCPAEESVDAYSTLGRALLDTRLQQTTAFATLNYECILDAALSRLGLLVAYFDTEPSDRRVPLWKVHGACNLVADLGSTLIVESGFSGAEHYVEAPITSLPLEALPYHFYGARASPFPPAMSLFAPGKHSPVVPEAIEQSREYWAAWVRGSEVVLVVGASPMLADEHVWQPVIEADAAVWYVGGTERDFGAFETEVGQRLDVLGPYFAEALPEIMARLEGLAA
jgi:hypothetical protein